VAGGALVVRGASGLALRLGLSSFVVGAVVVGFGTSLPELATSLDAAWSGAPGIAVGNVVGSNVANILLILGLAAALSPIAAGWADVKIDASAMILAALAAVALVALGSLGRGGGLILVALLVAYLVVTIRFGAPAEVATGAVEARSSLLSLVGLFLLGLVITIAGARLLVVGAVDLARIAGVSETVIGLTVVSVGTSLPELVTSVIAARRGQSGMALGNVLGSNVFNVLGILGLTALVVPLDVPSQIAAFDIWVMLVVTLALAALIWLRGHLGRLAGLAALALYAAYLAALVLAV
jgi:cation:H+ antiporter